MVTSCIICSNCKVFCGGFVGDNRLNRLRKSSLPPVQGFRVIIMFHGLEIGWPADQLLFSGYGFPHLEHILTWLW